MGAPQSLNATIKKHARLKAYHEKQLEALYAKAKWCPKCQKYHEKDQFTTHLGTPRLERGVCILRDCGYGDDDKLADVTYQDMWWVCPKGHLVDVKDTFTVKVENERYRR